MSSSLIRRILHPTRKPKPDSTLSVSLFTTVSSPPSDPSNPTSPDPLISDAVSVLTHHRSKSRWSTLRSLHPSGFTPYQFSEITLRLRNNPHLSLRFFLFTRRYSLCSHDVDSCSTLVHILARSRLKTHARELIRLSLRLADDEDNETDRVSKVFRSLIKSYNRCGSAPFVFDLLIKSCLDSKEIDGAVMVMRKLRSKGINLQISTCNALISEASKRRDASTGYKLYREVFGLDETEVDEAKKLKPNVNTFNLMMVSFYREGETEIVEKIWREMEEEEVGCSPNAYSYNVLMETYCSRGMMIEAEKIWEEMKLKRLDLDVVSYNTMIGGLCSNLEVTKAKELCKEMRLKKGIECTSLTYDHLVKGYCKVGDVDSAMVVYKEMKRKSFEAEGLTIEALVEGLCGGDEGRVVEAAEIVKEAVRESEFYPSRKCYELLVKRLCEEGKMERALKIQAEMVGRGFKPSQQTYKAFINGYGSIGDEETSALLAIEMTDSLKLRAENKEESRGF